MIFFIWGSTVRTTEAGTGFFDCPRCQSRQPYRRLRNAMYFTLFFIPLFRTETLAEFVQCETCRNNSEVPMWGAEPSSQTWACPQCTQTNANHNYRCRHCGFSLV